MSTVILVLILIAGPLALFGVLCAINACTVGQTPRAIYLSFLGIAWGWGIVIFSAADLLWHVRPVMGEAFMPIGCMLLAVGNATLYFANRRTCGCLDCPERGRAEKMAAAKSIDWRMPG